MVDANRPAVGSKPPKVPTSVLVVMFSQQGRFLLIERADKAGYWQSVTGSLDHPDEPPLVAAVRELQEETGITAQADPFALPFSQTPLDDLAQTGWVRPWQHKTEYEIFEHWRHRYAPGVTHNTEHWFYVCLPDGLVPLLSPSEHVRFEWCDANEAARRCFSPNNAQAIERLARAITRSPE